MSKDEQARRWQIKEPKPSSSAPLYVAPSGSVGMGHWNYRLVKRCDDSWGLHEVFYNDKGEATAMTVNAIDFRGESKGDVQQMLEMAHDDAVNRFPFIEPPPGEWPVKETIPYGKAMERQEDESRQKESDKAS